MDKIQMDFLNDPVLALFGEYTNISISFLSLSPSPVLSRPDTTIMNGFCSEYAFSWNNAIPKYCCALEFSWNERKFYFHLTHVCVCNNKGGILYTKCILVYCELRHVRRIYPSLWNEQMHTWRWHIFSLWCMQYLYENAYWSNKHYRVH